MFLSSCHFSALLEKNLADLDQTNKSSVQKHLTRVPSVLRTGEAKTPTVQCNRMKILTQSTTVAICQESVDSF